MNLNYVEVVNNIYNHQISDALEYDYLHVANAVERFCNHFKGISNALLAYNELEYDEVYEIGTVLFGKYFAGIFPLFVEEVCK